jgi:AraC-like DNA-binding protein
MEINTIDVREYRTGRLVCSEDGLFHRKSLPCLSVVQALEGSYSIEMDSSLAQRTGPLGVFVAPKEIMQHITHHVDPDTGIMRAHWIFLYLTINGLYDPEDILKFPQILPSRYNQEVKEILTAIVKEGNLCDHLPDIYRLIRILIHTSTPKTRHNDRLSRILFYIGQQYATIRSPREIARHFCISEATLYRVIRTGKHTTPSNYLNSVRLARASILLETTDRTVGEIGREIGIEDTFYFSKLYKAKYGVSPANYRSSIIKAKDQQNHTKR